MPAGPQEIHCGRIRCRPATPSPRERLPVNVATHSETRQNSSRAVAARHYEGRISEILSTLVCNDCCL